MAYCLLQSLNTKSDPKFVLKSYPVPLSSLQSHILMMDDGNTVAIGAPSYNDGAANTMQVMCMCMTGMEPTGFHAVMTLMEMGLILLNLEVLSHLYW
jgi:hypothetical protein